MLFDADNSIGRPSTTEPEPETVSMEDFGKIYSGHRYSGSNQGGWRPKFMDRLLQEPVQAIQPNTIGTPTQMGTAAPLRQSVERRAPNGSIMGEEKEEEGSYPEGHPMHSAASAKRRRVEDGSFPAANIQPQGGPHGTGVYEHMLQSQQQRRQRLAQGYPVYGGTQPRPYTPFAFEPSGQGMYLGINNGMTGSYIHNQNVYVNSPGAGFGAGAQQHIHLRPSQPPAPASFLGPMPGPTNQPHPRTRNMRPRRGSHVTRRNPISVHEDNSAGPAMPNAVGAYGLLQDNTSAGNRGLSYVYTTPVATGPDNMPLASTGAPIMNVGPGLDPTFGDLPAFDNGVDTNTNPNPNFLPWVSCPAHHRTPGPLMNVGPGLDFNFGDMPPLNENAYTFNPFGNDVDPNIAFNSMFPAYPPVPKPGGGYAPNPNLNPGTMPPPPHAPQMRPMQYPGPPPQPALFQQQQPQQIPNARRRYIFLPSPEQEQLAADGHQCATLAEHHRVVMVAPEQWEPRTGQGHRADLRDKKWLADNKKDQAAEAEAKKLTDTGAGSPSV